VGAFIVYFNVNFNILKQINCALVGLIMDWITLADVVVVSFRTAEQLLAYHDESL